MFDWLVNWLVQQSNGTILNEISRAGSMRCVGVCVVQKNIFWTPNIQYSNTQGVRQRISIIDC